MICLNHISEIDCCNNAIFLFGMSNIGGKIFIDEGKLKSNKNRHDILLKYLYNYAL